jgi:hypothetical protein
LFSNLTFGRFPFMMRRRLKPTVMVELSEGVAAGPGENPLDIVGHRQWVCDKQSKTFGYTGSKNARLHVVRGTYPWTWTPRSCFLGWALSADAPPGRLPVTGSPAHPCRTLCLPRSPVERGVRVPIRLESNDRDPSKFVPTYVHRRVKSLDAPQVKFYYHHPYKRFIRFFEKDNICCLWILRGRLLIMLSWKQNSQGDRYVNS